MVVMARVYKPKPVNYQPPRMCSGKRCYISKHEAQQVAEEQYIINDVELTIYKCLSCHQFHLTSIKKVDEF
jgi:hypothetical protein